MSPSGRSDDLHYSLAEGAFQLINSKLRWPALLLLCIALTACIEPSTTLRRERQSGELVRASGRPATQTSGAETYTVQGGDTLFRIAFRFQTTVDELVRWNQIADRNRIQVGQRLRVAPAGSPSGSPAAVLASNPVTTAPASAAESGAAQPSSHGVPADALPATASTTVATVDTGTGVVTAAVSDGVGSPASSAPARQSQSLAENPRPVDTAVAPAPTLAEADPEATLVSPANATSVPPAGAAPAITSVAAPNAVRSGWSWPVAGRLAGTFVAGDATRSGIDITGTEGQAVYAAADGEVLFSGTGIIGYGELIVIQHPNGLLSAYGHSRRRMVNEGAKIKRGQQIAEMGRDASGRQMLHFEVRKAGKPVDPLAYLPGR